MLPLAAVGLYPVEAVVGPIGTFSAAAILDIVARTVGADGNVEKNEHSRRYFDLATGRGAWCR
jgi:hypothetical protein